MNSKQLFFAYIKPPNFSGQSAATDLIIQELRKRNWQCNTLPLYPLQRSIDNPIIRWYHFIRGQLLILPKLFGVATARKPVIHISLGQSFMSFTRIATWLIPILIIRPKCVIIIALNGSTFMGWEKNQFITKYFLFFLKKAVIISVLGNRQKNKLEQLEVQSTEAKESVTTLGSYVITLEERIDTLTQEIEKAPVSKQATSQEKKQYHNVVRGDTLYSISRKYGLSVEEIRRLNNLNKNQPIQPGQKLMVTADSHK